eukprot:4849619-Amphidinium_carterae.1
MRKGVCYDHHGGAIKLLRPPHDFIRNVIKQQVVSHTQARIAVPEPTALQTLARKPNATRNPLTPFEGQEP